MNKSVEIIVGGSWDIFIGLAISGTENARWSIFQDQLNTSKAT